MTNTDIFWKLSDSIPSLFSRPDLTKLVNRNTNDTSLI